MRFYISTMFLLFSIICTGQPTGDEKNYIKVVLAFYNSFGRLLQLMIKGVLIVAVLSLSIRRSTAQSQVLIDIANGNTVHFCELYLNDSIALHKGSLLKMTKEGEYN